MKIVFAASEAAPFIKTGGLGDVAQALPKALAEYKGNQILLFLPYYASIKSNPSIEVERVAEFTTRLSWRNAYVGLMRLKSKKRKLRVYFIDNEQYFGRARVYGECDDGERFAYFCKAILESLVYLGETPDIIHCNDWLRILDQDIINDYNARMNQLRKEFKQQEAEKQRRIRGEAEDAPKYAAGDDMDRINRNADYF